MDDYVDHHLRELRRGDSVSAFHSLIEAGPDILPRMEREFQAEADPRVRAALVEVIGQLRQPECLPVLALALADAEAPVWQDALNGLVALAGPEAIAATEAALAGADSRGRDAQVFREWVAEALEQAREQVQQAPSPERRR